jgi:hypothetical protein
MKLLRVRAQLVADGIGGPHEAPTPSSLAASKLRFSGLPGKRLPALAARPARAQSCRG